jgi:dCTP deaminase
MSVLGLIRKKRAKSCRGPDWVRWSVLSSDDRICVTSARYTRPHGNVCDPASKMILSDRDIRKAIDSGDIGIEPFDEADIQPSSVDLHVDRFFRTFHNFRHAHIDVKKQMDDLTELVEVKEDEAFILHPGEFVLGSTLEEVRLPNDVVGRLEGKSSLGRLGLLIHSTAGVVDPGFAGNLTLELSNVANLPITIYPKMKIGQLTFFQLSSAADKPYGSEDVGSKYQDQRGPTPSRYYENF